MRIDLTLNGDKHKKSTNKDLYQSLNLERDSAIIPVSNIDKTINTYKVFEEERNSCLEYGLNITLNPIMSNVLCNSITEVIPINGEPPLSGNARISAMQKINDDLYQYNIGYDIFDNHFQRVDTFKTGETLNDFTGTTATKIKTIQRSIKDNLIEEDGWVSLLNKVKIGGLKMFNNKNAYDKIDLFPTRDYFLLNQISLNGEMFENWSYHITYPFENYYNHNLVKSDIGLNGIPIISSLIQEYNKNNYLVITTMYKHGLQPNDVIKIKRDDDNSDKTYLIYDIGDVNKDNKEHTFILDINKYADLELIVNMTNNRICRVINKTDSEYYIRVFRKLPNLYSDLESLTSENISNKILTGDTHFDNDKYQPGFLSNIFKDSEYQIQYTDNINISLIKDNLNRPLTQLYFTIIKKNIMDGNHKPYNVFTKVVSGVDTITNVTGYSNIRVINGIDMEMPIETNITSTGSTINNTPKHNMYLGDIAEYNKSTVKEVILDDIYHRFNTVERETNNKIFNYHDINSNGNLFLTGITLGYQKEGYYYKPHHLIQLKNISSVINQGELVKISDCFGIKSGITFDNQIVDIINQTDDNVKSLILKLKGDNTIGDYDRVRITRNSDGKYITVVVMTYNNIDNGIILPYDKYFMPSISTIDISDYTIRRYGDINIPEYAQDTDNDLCLWRNILGEGIFDNESTYRTEHVFTNGRLYIHKNINLFLRRQDPFGYYGIRNNTFPTGFYGGSVKPTILNNSYNRTNNIC